MVIVGDGDSAAGATVAATFRPLPGSPREISGSTTVYVQVRQHLPHSLPRLAGGSTFLL